MQSCLSLAVMLKALTESPLTSSNLPISTLSVHLSRLRVDQYIIYFSALVRQREGDIILTLEGIRGVNLTPPPLDFFVFFLLFVC